MRKKTPGYGLDEVLVGKVPERLLDSVKEMNLTVGEMIEWDESKPRFRLVATEHGSYVVIRIAIPTKKTLGIVGGLVGFAWAFTNLMAQHLPGILSFLQGLQPKP